MRTNFRLDQAAGLRRMANPRPVKVMAIASGKGGVGKTNVSINLSMALSQSGKDVLLLDADLGLANVDVLLGLRPRHTLSDVIKGARTLEEIIISGPESLKIIPASSGIQTMTELNTMERAGIIRAFSELSHSIDVLMIDSAAGISDSVMTFTRAAQEVIVVVCDEPTSITDAYALIKVLNKDHGIRRFRVISNMVHSLQEGRELFKKIMTVTDKYLDVQLDFMGIVPYDDYLKRAVQRQRAVVDAYPRSKSAMAFKSLAIKADKWPIQGIAGGHVEFFVERLIQANQEMEASL
ncbi:MAG: MinD/ParA family protein [Gammaproteobacteria bacterium]